MSEKVLKKKYIPIREKIVVEVDRSDHVSAGGILLAHGELDKDAREEGVIVSMGSKVFFDTDGIEEELKIGDRVLFSRYAGKRCNPNDPIRELRVMKDIDICCKVEFEEN